MMEMLEINFVDGDKTYKGYINADNIEYVYRMKSYTVIGLVSGKTCRAYEKPETLFKATADASDGKKETKGKRSASKK